MELGDCRLLGGRLHSERSELFLFSGPDSNKPGGGDGNVQRASATFEFDFCAKDAESGTHVCTEVLSFKT